MEKSTHPAPRGAPTDPLPNSPYGPRPARRKAARIHATSFAQRLPESISFYDTISDVSPDTLFPEELDIVKTAVHERIAEFATARHCARRALKRLGHTPTQILTGTSREPLWPEGVVGSLTHCSGYRAAAVGNSRQLLAIGIDAEQNAPLPTEVVPLVTSETERLHLTDLSQSSEYVFWDRLLFSAKESIFKAWFPIERSWLEFTDYEIQINTSNGSFVGSLRNGLKNNLYESRFRDLKGQWVLSGDKILTGVHLPARVDEAVRTNANTHWWTTPTAPVRDRCQTQEG